MLANLKITEYLEKAAAGTAVPGGGSVAALNACLAASLTEMVANLTIGKKGYEAVEEEMKDVARKAAELRKLLTASIDRDADAYSEVMAAFKLPRATDRESGRVRPGTVPETIRFFPGSRQSSPQPPFRSGETQPVSCGSF